MRFRLILILFVASILVLILRPNLISILLGWDGLGLSSYLLVVYYNSAKSYNAGIITALTNRVGDGLIISAVGLALSFSSLTFLEFKIISQREGKLVVLLVVLGAFTKRAQIPFRSWLPAAIAAPTPVSSLVHSSTLVTAGVYLLIRLDGVLSETGGRKAALWVGSLTIFIARIRAFSEIDGKKIIALSTLSQLGVMVVRLGLGLPLLSFFHLLTHAFFKALLFVRAGNLIHNSERYQDLRKISGKTSSTPLGARIIVVCRFSLCGLPFMSAFYSKEAILEHILIYSERAWAYFIFLIGVGMTIFYRARLIVLGVLSKHPSSSILRVSDHCSWTNTSIMILIIPAVVGGARLRASLGKFYSLIWPSSQLKWATLGVIVLRVFIIGWSFKNQVQTADFIKDWVGFNLWSLPLISAQLPLSLSKALGGSLRKKVDLIWLPFYHFKGASTGLIKTSASKYIRVSSALGQTLMVIALASVTYLVVYLCNLN